MNRRWTIPAAAALVALPERPGTARRQLADICRRSGQEQAAAVFRVGR